MLGISYCFLNGHGTSFNVLIKYGKFKFNFLFRGQLERLSLDQLFFILLKIPPCYEVFSVTRFLSFSLACSAEIIFYSLFGAPVYDIIAMQIRKVRYDNGLNYFKSAVKFLIFLTLSSQVLYSFSSASVVNFRCV